MKKEEEICKHEHTEARFVRVLFLIEEFEIVCKNCGKTIRNEHR